MRKPFSDLSQCSSPLRREAITQWQRWLILLFASCSALVGDGTVEAKALPLSEEEVEARLMNLAEETDRALRIRAIRALDQNIIDTEAGWREAYTEARINKLVALFEEQQSVEVKVALGILLVRIGDRAAVPFLVSVVEQGECPDLGYPSKAYRTPYPFDRLAGSSPSQNTLTHVLDVLRMTRDERMIEPMIKEYQRIRDSFRDGVINHQSVEVLMGVAFILGAFGTSEALDVLVNDLKDPRTGGLERYPGVLPGGLGVLPDGHSWTTYGRHLGVIPIAALNASVEQPQVRQTLIDVLLNDWSEPIRCYAANLLGSVRHEQGVHEAFVKSFRADPSRRVRSEIVRSLWGGEWWSTSPPGFRPVSVAYVNYLKQETDPQMQHRLLQDLLVFARTKVLAYPLWEENEILVLQQLMERTDGTEIKQAISSLFTLGADFMLESWADASPEWRMTAVQRLRLLRPYLSRLQRQRLKQLEQDETKENLKAAMSEIVGESKRLEEAERPHGVERIFDEAGALLREKEYRLGQLVRERNYKNGRLDGVWREYDEDRKDLAERHYQNGVLHGPERIFNGAGQLLIEREYKKDRLDGMEKKYDAGGRLVSEQTYKSGKLHGISRGYYPDGSVHFEHRYQEGKLTGIGREYYPDGQLRGERKYLNGIDEFEQTTFDNSGVVVWRGRYVGGTFVPQSQQ